MKRLTVPVRCALRWRHKGFMLRCGPLKTTHAGNRRLAQARHLGSNQNRISTSKQLFHLFIAPGLMSRHPLLVLLSLYLPGFFLPGLFLSGLFLPGLSLAAEKTVYGLNEYAELADIDLQVAAKLDTGAKTASLSARDIKRFKRNGESWVRFYLAIDDAHEHPIERPLARVSRIKRRAGDIDADDDRKYTARPVISLDVCMGGALRTIEVNLTDRSAFQYPLLIGSEALKHFDALVDPSLKYAAGKPACVTDAQTAE
jgi:hypothetical protein